MPSPTHGDAPDPLAAAAAMVEVLERAAPAGEAERTLSGEVMDAAERSGIFAMVTPGSHGGMGSGLGPLCDATRTMAHGCCASAWTLSFLVLHNWLVSRFPAETRDELWARRPYAHVAAPLAPTGTARRVGRDSDGGWLVEGRWEWATGINQAEWVMVHAVERGTEPAGDVPFATRFALVPVSSATVEDVWFTSGMRATGSNAVVLEGVEVPDRHTVPGTTMLGTDARTTDGLGAAGRTGVGYRADADDRPDAADRAEAGNMTVPDAGSREGRGASRLDRLPLMAVLGLVAASPALGAAEAVVDIFEHRMAERVLAYTMGDRQIDQPAARIRLATALAEVRAARALWTTAIDSLTAAGDSPGGVSLADRADARLAAASVVRMSRSAISTVAEGSGASVYSETSPLQRFQRDVEVLKGHVVFDWDRSAELAARVLLGMDLGPTDLV